MDEFKEGELIIYQNGDRYEIGRVVSTHPDGAFVEYIKYYGGDCGISVCGQYDEEDEFHVEYYFPFLQGLSL